MSALSQTAANVVSGTGTIRKSTAVSGGTITAGMPIYQDSADDTYKAARANAAATANVRGIALHGASSGQPLTIQNDGNINLGATLAVGETYCVSDAVAGQIVPIGDLGSGDYPTILGIAVSTSILALDIQVGGVAKA